MRHQRVGLTCPFPRPTEQKGGRAVSQPDHSREPSVAHFLALCATAQSNLAALGSALTVYPDEVPDHPVYPYVVFWATPAAPMAAAARLKGYAGEVTVTTQATVAGLTRLDVLGGLDRLTTALHRRRLVLAGRVTGDIEQEGTPTDPVPDPVLSPDGHQVWAARQLYTVHSSPRNTT